MEVKETVRRFYNSNSQGEWERLERHPIEFAVTRHFLDRYVKPGDRVLDIGGGPGRYSLYLAEQGCDVTLLDLSDENVHFAEKEADRRGLTLKAVQGDACIADQVVSGCYDHVLLMGPMYHLLEETQRSEAVAAALRLLRPDGLLFVSFISLYAGFSYFMKEMPEGVLLPSEQDYIQCYLEDRTYCGDAFTTPCFIAPREIEPFMA